MHESKKSEFADALRACFNKKEEASHEWESTYENRIAKISASDRNILS